MLDFRLARFATVGVANTCFGLMLIFSCKAFIGMPDALANLLGYAAALLLGFHLNRNWTFAHSGDPVAAWLRYSLVLAFAYLLNLGSVLFAIQILHLNSYAAQAMGVLPYAIAGYVGARLFAFRAA